MAGVAVLQPQDCLQEVTRVSPTRSRTQPPPRRKRSPNTSPSPGAAARSINNKGNRNGLVKGPIRILKRGEALPKPAPSPPPPPAVRASDLGQKRPIPKPAKPRTKPEPFYAGSASFITSPPPSSLPLPPFFGKKVEDDANVDLTRGLQRLIGREL